MYPSDLTYKYLLLIDIHLSFLPLRSHPESALNGFTSQFLSLPLYNFSTVTPTPLSIMSSGRLVGKIAVITGSSSGIGRAIALAYAMEGANIVCSDIREEARTEKAEASELTTVQEVEKLGQKVIFVRCDTSKEEDVENLIKRAVETFKRVDMYVPLLRSQPPSPKLDIHQRSSKSSRRKI